MEKCLCLQNQLSKIKQPFGRGITYSERQHSSQKEKYLRALVLFVQFFLKLQTLC